MEKDMMTYRENFGRSADFRVRYRWLGLDSQTHMQELSQHLRLDFAYQDDPKLSTSPQLFMIYPEFEAEDGSIIPEGGMIPPVGTAGMWVVIDKMRLYHRKIIRLGVKGFMMAGPTPVAEVEVIEIGSLTSVPGGDFREG